MIKTIRNTFSVNNFLFFQYLLLIQGISYGDNYRINSYKSNLLFGVSSG